MARKMSRRASAPSRPAAPWACQRQVRRVPRLEPLEGRALLTATHPFPFTDIRFGGALYEIAVNGPGGVVAHRTGHGTVAVTLAGTTQDSQVTVSLLQTHDRTSIKKLAVDRVNVRTGRLGSFQGLTTTDLLGPVSPLQGPVSSLQFDAMGPAARVDVAGNLGQLTVNQGVTLGSSGHIRVASDLTGAVTVAGNIALNGGDVSVGRDATGPVTVAGDVTAFGGGGFRVGRDLGTAAGNAFRVGGNVVLASGGTLAVGRQLFAMTVGGNLDTSQGGTVQVGGDFRNLTVNGVIRGSGAADVVVGLELSQLTVLGSGGDIGGIQGANITVGKNLQGLDVRYGVFRSVVSAGVLIDGGPPATGSNGWNIGPDGPVAVFDSEITAGTVIRNLTIGGDVVSDHPTYPAGRPTRIIAGVDPQGYVTAGGIIDNFQIVGKLLDAVVAASVQPYGGTGVVASTSTSTSDDAGFKTFDKPAGIAQVGVVGNAVTIPIFTAPPYDAPGDPTIDDWVLPGGAINPSFAPRPLAAVPPPAAGTHLPLPSKSTVLGGVISTSHGDAADFAGFFSANTSGVFVGVLPP